ncbi:threonine--tRNA ligase [Candidatus Uhrbacteria bacterium]|nr:threonine--tRNA ligase [Candidatus Uhrbacteria bacterium]
MPELNPVETMRHSAAHLLAAAVLELYPGTKLGVGPVVEHGFFYDFQFPRTVSSEDLPKIEKKMREIQKRNEAFRREELPLDKAITFFQERKQRFKVDLLKDLKTKGTTAVKPEEAQDIDVTKPSVASVYWTGNFVDLCRGPHVRSTREIGAFKLTKVAGAYWRGNDKNPQLTRVYGVAFAHEADLKAHLAMIAEAERRDHRKLGLELDLFTFSELVGSGLPLWTPKGTFVRDLLDSYVWELRKSRGYERVDIPHITKKDLYERSGHWEKFKDELFRIETREGHLFAMKPMNCPHHTQIYARRQWSYRELPQRYASTTKVYRDEQTGELSGLARVRSITQDDAHVFCRETQIKPEFLKIWDIIHAFYRSFGFKLRLRLSLHDPKHPEKYLGDKTRWYAAESALREILKGKRAAYVEAIGEAAFYGPKLDFLANDSLGREWQVATIQLDMNMPDRFDLSCVNEAGESERIVMIHAAIMGSIERFLVILIEHLAGAFPTWLSPVQVTLVPVGSRHVKPAKKLEAHLHGAGIRVELDDANETVGYKIRKAEKHKVPYMLVLGDKETKGLSARSAARKRFVVRIRGKKDTVTMSGQQFVRRVQGEVEHRK